MVWLGLNLWIFFANLDICKVHKLKNPLRAFLRSERVLYLLVEMDSGFALANASQPWDHF